ncbi:hypothetical protein D3C86_1373800 [compost metagenome]
MDMLPFYLRYQTGAPSKEWYLGDCIRPSMPVWLEHLLLIHKTVLLSQNESTYGQISCLCRLLKAPAYINSAFHNHLATIILGFSGSTVGKYSD